MSLTAIVFRSLAHSVLVPSHDLADPGHRISRHKLDLATRIILSSWWQKPHFLQKSPFWYWWLKHQDPKYDAQQSWHSNSTHHHKGYIHKFLWIVSINVSTKACFVYIYINLEMSEAVEETDGYPDHGFSACCSTSRSSNTSCLETGLLIWESL